MKIKLIIGIGNPDEKYQETRHNVGFMMVGYIAEKCKADFSAKGGPPPEADEPQAQASGWDKKLNAEIMRCKIDKSSVVLAKPQTYVNKSGETVKKLAKTYNLKPNDLLVVQDDLDIPFGKTKLSFDKNSGGHKGVESVMRALKTKKFYRLRIGLATRSLMKARQQSSKKRDIFVHDFVLSKFSKKEKEDLKQIFKAAYEKLLQL